MAGICPWVSVHGAPRTPEGTYCLFTQSVHRNPGLVVLLLLEMSISWPRRASCALGSWDAPAHRRCSRSCSCRLTAAAVSPYASCKHFHVRICKAAVPHPVRAHNLFSGRRVRAGSTASPATPQAAMPTGGQSSSPARAAASLGCTMGSPVFRGSNGSRAAMPAVCHRNRGSIRCACCCDFVTARCCYGWSSRLCEVDVAEQGCSADLTSHKAVNSHVDIWLNST